MKKITPGFFQIITFAFLLVTQVVFAQRSCTNTSQTVSSLNFQNPAFVSGTNNGVAELNDVYRFSNVVSGVDALVTVSALVNGATLPDFDRPAVAEGTDGFSRAFQPTLRTNGNNNTLATFTIQFVTTGTTTAVPLTFKATALDVDGDAANLRELVRMSPQPDTYSYNNPTGITFSTAATYLQGIATNTTVEPGTGTSPQFAFTNTYVNRSQITYSIGNSGTTTVDRQFSLLFEDISYPTRVDNNLTAPLICGVVRDDSGVPLAGVTVNLTGAQTLTTTTANDGSYSFTTNKTGVTTASNYTIRAPLQPTYLYLMQMVVRWE